INQRLPFFIGLSLIATPCCSERAQLSRYTTKSLGVWSIPTVPSLRAAVLAHSSQHLWRDWKTAIVLPRTRQSITLRSPPSLSAPIPEISNTKVTQTTQRPPLGDTRNSSTNRPGSHRSRSTRTWSVLLINGTWRDCSSALLQRERCSRRVSLVTSDGAHLSTRIRGKPVFE
ncbi:hypothetical protein CH063_11063, partial [Colletotrichum higginsianum]